MTDPKKNKQPIDGNREPESKPQVHPSTGEHDHDIQDESTNKRNNRKPQPINQRHPEDDPRDYNDGEPVEEKSPRLPSNL